MKWSFFFFIWNTKYNLSKLYIRLDNLVMWNKKDPKIITKEKNLSFTELQKEWKIIHHMLQCWPGLIGLWELKVKRILGVYASNNSKLSFFKKRNTHNSKLSVEYSSGISISNSIIQNLKIHWFIFCMCLFKIYIINYELLSLFGPQF